MIAYLGVFLNLTIFFLRNETQAITIVERSFTSHQVESPGGQPYLAKYVAYIPDNLPVGQHVSYVIFLHGKGGDRYFFKDLNGHIDLDLHVKDKKNPFIVFAPNGRADGEPVDGYWLNAAKEGTHKMRWANLITLELTKDIEENFPVIKNNPKARLIAGISMGGNGALQIGMNYPNVFGAIASHSPIFRAYDDAARDFYFQYGDYPDYELRDPVSMLHKNIIPNVPVWMDTGKMDFGYPRALECANLLEAKSKNQKLFKFYNKVGHDPIGGHSNPYWDHNFTQYFNWYGEQLSIPKPLNH